MEDHSQSPKNDAAFLYDFQFEVLCQVSKISCSASDTRAKEDMMSTMDSETKYETMPIYKYLVCPDGDRRMDWVRQILVEHKFFFASRLLFNDPFDCGIPDLAQIPGTFLKKFVEEFVDRKFSSASEAEKNHMIEKLMSVNTLENIRNGLQSEVDKAGIVCFSKVRDDILMWSHYADKHKGLCLEFDGSSNCIFFGEAQPVEYEDYTPIPLREDSNRQVTRAILTKSKHWSYEREYRIFRPGIAGHKLNYPVELLTGIIFGCMMPEKIRETIKQWATQGGCRVAFSKHGSKWQNLVSIL